MRDALIERLRQSARRVGASGAAELLNEAAAALEAAREDAEFHKLDASALRSQMDVLRDGLDSERERAESLRAEVEEARDGWHMANDTAELAMKHRDEAEARAERLAEALRGIAAMKWSEGDELQDASTAARDALEQE